MKSTFRLALSLGLICTMGFAAQANSQKVETRKVITKGTQNGVSGTWVKYYQDSYNYEYSIASIKQVYLSELKITLTDTEATAIVNKLKAGTLTESQLNSGITLAKDLLPMKADQGLEWNSRRWDLAELRERFGNIGGSCRDADKLPASYPGPYYDPGEFQLGNRSSMISEASRLIQLAELMESGILPEGKVSVEGIFSSNYGVQDSSYYYSETTKQKSANSTFNNWGQEVYKVSVKNATIKDLIAAAKDVYEGASETGSPIVLDLTGNNRIGVTGNSTARKRAKTNDFVEAGSVMFDLFGEGKDIHIEWMSTEGDGFLVDDRKGAVTKAARTDGVITGNELFGSAGGYDNGYIKLAMVSNHNRIAMQGNQMVQLANALKGDELKGLKVWVDKNHDAKVQANELSTLDALGITEVSIWPNRETNERGETLIRSSYVEKGQKKMAEDVWFAIDPKEK